MASWLTTTLIRVWWWCSSWSVALPCIRARNYSGFFLPYGMWRKTSTVLLKSVHPENCKRNMTDQVCMILFDALFFESQKTCELNTWVSSKVLETQKVQIHPNTGICDGWETFSPQGLMHIIPLLQVRKRKLQRSRRNNDKRDFKQRKMPWN